MGILSAETGSFWTMARETHCYCCIFVVNKFKFSQINPCNVTVYVYSKG